MLRILQLDCLSELIPSCGQVMGADFRHGTRNQLIFKLSCVARCGLPILRANSGQVLGAGVPVRPFCSMLNHEKNK